MNRMQGGNGCGQVDVCGFARCSPSGARRRRLVASLVRGSSGGGDSSSRGTTARAVRSVRVAGALCANLVLMTSPEKIVLSGGVMLRASLFPRVRAAVQKHLNG